MCKGFHQNDRDRLKIKAFYVHLGTCSAKKDSALADSLTLHYLPRINGSALEIDGSSIRPDSPAFVTLHRVVSPDKVTRGAIYGSRERVKASEGSRFEIYMSDVKVLKGIFRKDDQGQNWKMECTCELENDDDAKVKEAEVCVAVEGQVGVINEKVEMAAVRKKRRSGRLEEIPEEREVEDEVESEGCHCGCCDSNEINGGDCELAVEMEMEGVRWAVDVGIWVMCLGVGYLVTKASSKSLRRRGFI